MRTRTKTEALRVVFDCAVQYRDNLEAKNVLFVTVREDKAVCFEALFMPHNFMHLTGISSRLNAELFYRAAVNRRLSERDISLASDGTTDLKLDILPRLMNIHIVARMVGDYDRSKPLLITDKFAGTVTMAMGFIRVNEVYMPSTALKKDLREITTQATRCKVAAIFVKARANSLYTRLTYIAKGMTIDDDLFSQVINGEVDKANLVADFSIPRKL